MKYLIASDIHGSAYYCKKLIDQFEMRCADKLILLGDLLYHGPRNSLPLGYNPAEVAKMLNKIADKIICIKGNCDCEVDQMMLDFPIMAEFAIMPWGNKTIFMTHGHKYGADAVEGYYKAMAAYKAAIENGEPAVKPNSIPAIATGDVLLQGHTHQSVYYTMECGVINVNPGSVSISKGGGSCGFMTFEDGVFVRYDMDGREERKYEIETKAESDDEATDSATPNATEEKTENGDANE